jgi:short-subunit dehydrogenase
VPDANHPRPLAVVTGASSGIGLALAEELVERGHDVVAVAETANVEDPALLGVTPPALAIRADLRSPAEVERVHREVEQLGQPVDVLALNAGVGQGGPFPGGNLAEHLGVVDLNVRSTVHLAGLLLPAMIERGAGRVLVTSSIGAEVPAPFQSTYHASKSFVHSFAEALRIEVKDQGVTVTSLMPGPTETNFFDRADLDDTRIGQMEKDEAHEVARAGLDALFAGKDHVIPGSFKNKVLATLGSHLPDAPNAKAQGKLNEPGSGT